MYTFFLKVERRGERPLLSSILFGVLLVLRANATHAAGVRAWGEPWQERRERNEPRDKPFPRVQHCLERHAIVGVWLVKSRQY
jgi:hypothetical protein